MNDAGTDEEENDKAVGDRQVVDAILADQRARWLRGDRVRAEELAADHPELTASSELVVELAYHEYLLGRELGGGPQVDELTARFPEHAEAFARQVALGTLFRSAVVSTWSGSEQMAAVVPAAPEWLGRFEIDGEIGRGRFGIVYAAHDTTLDRKVAIKVARPEFAEDQAFVDRFLGEASAAARLEDDGIVRVYEPGSDGESLYFVMEFCEGSDLATWLEGKESPVDPQSAVELTRQIARAVHVAHENGVVHRDLKPANVMLSPVGADGDRWRVRILDFGLARSVGDQLSDTRSSVILGTPLYMAPEQAERGRSDVRTDVFSIGAILYELLTGRPPFLAENVAGVFEHLKSCEPVPPSRLVPGLDPTLDTICLRCLRRFPEDRYQSAAELRDDLERHLGGEPIRARRVRWYDRLDAWMRQPARIREYGWTVTVTSVLHLIWTYAACVFKSSLSGYVDDYSASDARTAWLFTLLVITPPHAFAAYVGWRAARGRASCRLVRGGLIVMATLTVLAVGGQVGVLPPATQWYEEHGVAMQVVYSGITLLIATETFFFVVLSRAQCRRDAER